MERVFGIAWFVLPQNDFLKWCFVAFHAECNKEIVTANFIACQFISFFFHFKLQLQESHAFVQMRLKVNYFPINLIELQTYDKPDHVERDLGRDCAANALDFH